jgi:gluconate kinase
VRDFTRVLDGQYRDLEPPAGADALTVSAEHSPHRIVEQVAVYVTRLRI